MEYDPLKDRAARLIDLFPALRKVFYRALDLALLRQRYVKRLIRKYFKEAETLRYHDAGAGLCQYSHYVLRNWPRSKVFATDLKGDYLSAFAAFASAEGLSGFSWQSADLQSFTPRSRYDLITAIDILEHIGDDLAVLRNFHSCLAPGGLLIISTPSDRDVAARFTSEHVRPGYNKAELEAKLRSLGFEILESRFSYGKYGSLAWRLLIRNPLRLLDRTKLAVLLLPLYLAAVYPFAELLMQLDLATDNPSGTGIVIVARRGA